MQHKALAPRQLAHSPFTPVKVIAKIQLESQTLPRLRVARMGVNLRLPLIRAYVDTFHYLLTPIPVYTVPRYGTSRYRTYGTVRSRTERHTSIPYVPRIQLHSTVGHMSLMKSSIYCTDHPGPYKWPSQLPAVRRERKIYSIGGTD